jgi:hypothetical protein
MKTAKLFLILCIPLLTNNVFAQIYVTRNGNIRFFSQAPLENIEAVNRQVNAALNTSNGEFAFRLLMRAFSFEKALMQEHFNDNFVESHKYPNAMFQGNVLNIEDINLKVNGQYNVTVEGDLTIKDVTRKIREPGTLTIKDGAIIGASVFKINLADFNINIPNRYIRNIASEIEIFVNVELRER